MHQNSCHDSFSALTLAISRPITNVRDSPVNSLGGLGWDGFYVRTTAAGCKPTEHKKGNTTYYGNPRVSIDDMSAVVNSTSVLDLTNSSLTQAVSTDINTMYGYEADQEFVLLDDLDQTVCDSIPDVEDASSKTTFGQLSTGEHVLFDPMYVLESNTIEAPLPDAGGLSQHITVGEAFCANIPRTFLNEASCRMSDQPSTCGPIELPKVYPNMTLTLNHTTMRTFYDADDRYVFSVEGLIVNSYSGTDPPCQVGAKSRWIPLDASSTPVCNTSRVSNITADALGALLQNSADGNPHMREIVFPSVGSCDGGDEDGDGTDDINEKGYDINAEGTCWRHVHQDHLSVFDFTAAKSTSEVQTVANSGSTRLVLPATDQMIHGWNNNRHLFIEVGRLGDEIEFKNLPTDELRTEAIARAFGADGIFTDGTGVMVCGSPGEVANDPLRGGSEGMGGFDIAIGGGRDSGHFPTWFRQVRQHCA